MKIEGNQKELDAMVEFHKGNRVEGLRLQEEFAAEFRKEYKDMKIARTFQIMKPLKNLSVLDNVTAAAYFGHAGAKSEKEAKEHYKST